MNDLFEKGNIALSVGGEGLDHIPFVFLAEILPEVLNENLNGVGEGISNVLLNKSVVYHLDHVLLLVMVSGGLLADHPGIHEVLDKLLELLLVFLVLIQGLSGFVCLVHFSA